MTRRGARRLSGHLYSNRDTPKLFAEAPQCEVQAPLDVGPQSAFEILAFDANIDFHNSPLTLSFLRPPFL